MLLAVTNTRTMLRSIAVERAVDGLAVLRRWERRQAISSDPSHLGIVGAIYASGFCRALNATHLQQALEFKVTCHHPMRVARHRRICEHFGGRCWLVLKTAPVMCVGSPILSVQERLANLLSDNVLPRLVPELESCRGGAPTYWLCRSILATAGSRPSRVGPERGVYVRVAPRIVRRTGKTDCGATAASPPGKATTKSRYRTSTLKPLTQSCFRVVPSKRKLKKTDLDTATHRDKTPGRRVPTVGGVLLFGHERERRFPDAWFQAGRLTGSTRCA